MMLCFCLCATRVQQDFLTQDKRKINASLTQVNLRVSWVCFAQARVYQTDQAYAGVFHPLKPVYKYPE